MSSNMTITATDSARNFGVFSTHHSLAVFHPYLNDAFFLFVTFVESGTLTTTLDNSTAQTIATYLINSKLELLQFSFSQRSSLTTRPTTILGGLVVSIEASFQPYLTHYHFSN